MVILHDKTITKRNRLLSRVGGYFFMYLIMSNMTTKIINSIIKFKSISDTSIL